MIRWTASRKKAVIEEAAKYGVGFVIDRHQISAQEFFGWQLAFDKLGNEGLKTTRTQWVKKRLTTI